jgi:ABC-2 type transport system permease protein
MYATMGAQADRFQDMISDIHPEFLAFWCRCRHYAHPGWLSRHVCLLDDAIIGIFAVIAGSGLIVSDEERGRLDLIIAHPVGRPSFFWGRILGLLVASLSIMFLGWLGFSILLGRSGMDFTWGQMAVPFLPLLVQLLIFAAFAFVLSMLLPSRSIAAMVSGVFVVISYFISSLAFIDDRLEIFTRLLPYHYYQTVLSFRELNLTWLIALLGISLLMVLLAYYRFSRRDIRLSGEGSWHWK